MINFYAVCGDSIAAERHLVRRLRSVRDGEPLGTVVPDDQVLHDDGGEEDEEDNAARREPGSQHCHKERVKYMVYLPSSHSLDVLV